MTVLQLQKLILGPLGLFVIMTLSSFVNGLKQLVTARMQGTTEITLRTYLGKYWPETLTAVIGNILAFAVLVATDQLNFASALGIGYGINSAADLIRSGGRSASLSQSPNEDPKV